MANGCSVRIGYIIMYYSLPLFLHVFFLLCHTDTQSVCDSETLFGLSIINYYAIFSVQHRILSMKFIFVNAQRWARRYTTLNIQYISSMLHMVDLYSGYININIIYKSIKIVHTFSSWVPHFILIIRILAAALMTSWDITTAATIISHSVVLLC